MTPIVTPHRGVRTKLDTGIFVKHELSNGITVWVQQTPVDLSDEGVLDAYFVNVGSILDPVGKEHVAHFLEHLPFKGTKLYPDTETLSGAVNDAGGNDNAATSRYWTDYRVFMPRESFELALSVLRELLLEPLMRPTDFETERGIIMSEYERRFESVNAQRGRELGKLLFGDHPIARTGGSPESINAITLEDVLSFRETYYHAGNLHLVVGGAFSTLPGLLERLEEAFGSMAKGPASVLALPPLPALPEGKHEILNPRFKRTRFHLNWLVREEVSFASDFALSLLINAFSAGIEAPLALELRDRRGLTYEGGLMSRARILNLGMHVELELPIPRDQFDDVYAAVMGLLRDLSDERIAKALDRWQVDRLSEFSFPTGVCARLGGDLVDLGRPESFHETEALLDDIDLDLVHWWKEYLLATPPTIVETGPER